MTGQVLHGPRQEHHCSPGVTYSTITKASEFVPAGLVGLRTLQPPTRWDYPPGTLWQCDDCGQVWESYVRPGADAAGMIGRIWFRKAGRLRLWWLRRRAR